MEKCSTKHLKDFLDLSTGELKFYLFHTHSDLAARALVAIEQDRPIKPATENLASSLKSDNENTLKDGGLTVDPLQLNAGEWEDDLTKWPRTHMGQIFSYILENKTFETEYIRQYKVRKAYSFFKTGFVHKVVVKSLSSERVLLSCCVTPSQRIREQPHQLWILCKTSGEIVCSYCSCTAGLSTCCNHVIAALYKVEFANIKGVNDPACTEKACAWNNSGKKDVQPKKIKEMVIREHNRTHPDQKYDINSTDRRNFDPRPLINRTITNEEKENFLKNMRDKLPTAVINITVVPAPDQDEPPALPDIAADTNYTVIEFPLSRFRFK